MNIIHKIGAAVITFILGIVGGHGVAQAPQLGSLLPIAGNTYNLSGVGVTASAASITLQSLTIKQTGQKILDADLSDTFYLTIEPGSNTKQEIVSCTTVVQNSGGTATLSGCIRGLSPISPYTASTTLAFPHAGSSQVTFSNPPQLYNRYAAKENNELISGAWTASSTNPWSYDQVFGITSSSTSKTIPYVSWIFNNFVDKYNNQTIAGDKSFTGTASFTAIPNSAGTPSSGSDLATKTYVDGQVVAGGTKASTTTPGVGYAAYRQDLVTPSGLSGGYVKFIDASTATSTFGQATTSVVVTLPSGLISATLLPATAGLASDNTWSGTNTFTKQVTNSATTTFTGNVIGTSLIAVSTTTPAAVTGSTETTYLNGTIPAYFLSNPGIIRTTVYFNAKGANAGAATVLTNLYLGGSIISATTTKVSDANMLTKIQFDTISTSTPSEQLTNLIVDQRPYSFDNGGTDTTRINFNIFQAYSSIDGNQAQPIKLTLTLNSGASPGLTFKYATIEKVQ